MGDSSNKWGKIDSFVAEPLLSFGQLMLPSDIFVFGLTLKDDGQLVHAFGFEPLAVVGDSVDLLDHARLFAYFIDDWIHLD